MPLRSSRSIRYRLSAIISALLVGVILAFAAAAYLSMRRSTVADTRERLAEVTKQLSDLLDISTGSMRANGRELARSPAVHAFLADSARAAPQLQATLRDYVAGARTSVGVNIWNASRATVFTSGGLVPQLDSAARRDLAALVAGKDTSAIGWMSASHDTVTFPVISRVHEGGAVTGYVVSWWMLDASPQARRQLAELIGSDARLFVGNTRGDLWTDLGRAVAAPAIDPQLMPRDTGTAYLEGQSHFSAMRRLTLAPWSVVLEFPQAPVLARPQVMLRDLSLYAVLLVLLGGALAWALAGTVTRPISELAVASRAVRAGDFSKRVSIRRADEIGELGTAFNEMAGGIEETQRELERKVSELGTSEARYRMLFESSPHPMWVYDAETLRFLAVNEEAIRAYGYGRDEFLAMTLLDIRPAEDASALGEELQRPAPVTFHRRPSRHRLKDDTLIDVEISSHALEFDGRPARLVVAHDVTERRRGEEALRATRQRLEHVLSASGAIIYRLRIVGSDTLLDWMSENVTRLFGYRVEETLDPAWWRRNVHPDDMASLVEAGARSPLHDATREYRFRRSDGVYRWVRDEQRVIRDGTGARAEIVGTWLDITEQRVLEEQFRQAQKLEAVGRLAGGVAHDFNNILTVILGECDLAIADIGEANPARESVLDIRRAGERAAHLTRQLLTFSRRQLVEPTVFSYNEVVVDMQSMLRRLIGENIEVKTRLDPALRPVRADVGQLEQVLVNLVVNAVDAMPNGGSLVIETANVSLDTNYTRAHAGVAPGEYAMLAVSDTGIGIPADARAHLFEPFFTTKEAGKGTGLGLATSYGIVKQFGGHIGVYSEVERGTTMKVYLPRASSQAVASEPQRAGLPLGGTETILLVEDDNQVRAVASRILRSRGYRVIESADGDDALMRLDAYTDPVHLLLTDVVLPSIGGRELSERVQLMRPETRVLFTSGYTEDVILQHRLLERGIALVQKPFSAESLLRKVREALDR